MEYIENFVVRDFERRDAERLYAIVREPEIIRFMRDWSENSPDPEGYYGYIDWLQSRKNSVDVFENMRYAIAQEKTDELIGMVGLGLEENLNEVEAAYFMSEGYRRRGYAGKALSALAQWCFQVSDLPYLVLSIDCANTPSCRLAERCGFQLFEKRTPVGHRQPNMESESYYYYRRYREAGDGE